jgi:hypothetical protein
VSKEKNRVLIGLSLILLILSLPQILSQPSSNEHWIITAPIRVDIKSTADWARIMFDDANGSNTNGLRLKQVLGYGWIMGNDENDKIEVGIDLTWYDILYEGETVTKTGDIISFFKENEDFDYVEMYSDVILEVNQELQQVYIFLMIAGKGTTTFQLTNKDTNIIIWKETISGDGRTMHVKRYIPSQNFLRSSTVGSITVISMAVVSTLILIGLNLPRIKRKK